MPGADGNNNKMVGNSGKSGEFDHSQARVVPAVQTNVPPGTKYVQICSLNKDTLLLAVDVKCHVKDVFGCCCSHLGIQDVRLFGLALRSAAEALGDSDRPRHEYRFLEHSHKLAKYAPKSWRMLAGWGTSPENRPLLVLHFRVRIYVDYVRLIRCPVALLHYYRQLRENLLEQWASAGCVSEEHCWETVALAVQADKGDRLHNEDDSTGFFRPEEYFPLWVINQYGLPYVLRNMPTVHNDLRGLDPTEAMVRFCREASKQPFALNCHLYGLRRHKLDVVDNALFGIATRGLELSDVMADGERVPIKSLLWHKIAKLGFDKRKVTVVGMEGSKMIFYAQTDDKARYLLEFCKSIHQQVMALQADINEARNIEMKERRTFKEAYIYSDGDLGPYDMLVGSTSLPAAGQRRSIVSDASSNTTSGIVSDRQHTHDDSDAERDADVDSSPIVSELSLSGGYHSSMNQSSTEMLIESPPPSLIGYSGEEVESRKDSIGGPCPSDHTITAGSDEDDDGKKSTPDSPIIRSRIYEEPEQERRIRTRSEPPNIDIRRLDELAKSAEFVIAAELSSLIGSNRSSLSSTMGRKTRDQSVGSSKIDISDLRQRTLNGYTQHHQQNRRVSDSSTAAVYPAASTGASSSVAAPVVSEATQTAERKLTNTLATQTELFDLLDKGTLMSIPSTVPLSDPELQDKERQLFRIVSKQHSFGNQAEIVTVQAPPVPKVGGSALPPYPGRTVSPPDMVHLERTAPAPQQPAIAPPPTHHFVAEQQQQQHARNRMQYMTSALSVEQQREWYRDAEQPASMLPAHQSYSMHDLSALRQPPGYSEAVRQQHNNNHHSHHANNKRWTTVSGIDPELMAQLAYNAPYASHHARSEPRLDQQWLALQEQRPISLPLTSSPLNGMVTSRTQMVTTPSGMFVKNQAAPRLPPTGRAGASRGISRVQSMPGHSAAYAYHPSDRMANTMLSHHSSTHQINTASPTVTTKEPPSYERALELQAMNLAQRDESSNEEAVVKSSPPLIMRHQEPLHKRHSYGNDSDSDQMTMSARLKNFPMIRALMQENQHSALMQQQQQQQQHQPSVIVPPPPFRVVDDGSGSRSASWHEQMMAQQRLMAMANGGPALYYPPPPPSPLFAARDDRRAQMVPMGNPVVSSRCFASTPNLGPSVGVVEMPPPPPYNPQSKPRNAPRVM